MTEITNSTAEESVFGGTKDYRFHGPASVRPPFTASLAGKLPAGRRVTASKVPGGVTIGKATRKVELPREDEKRKTHGRSASSQSFPGVTGWNPTDQD